MKGKIAKNATTELLQIAGITINGNQPWDIQVYNDQFYSRVLREGALGLGESYMDQWWQSANLDTFFYHLLRARVEKNLKKNKMILFKIFLARLLNFQNKHRALEVGKKHYDLGNFLFENMLDTRLVYTCGYWKNADNLEDAQLAKLDLTCQKLMLKPGMRILDIGCGWGSLAKHAAENYGVEVVGITISQQQVELAKKRCTGLPIDIRFQDYRDVNEKFDRIVSLGMFEHVGPLNYRTYFETAHRCLNDDGLFLLHTIGSNVTYFKTNEWTNKYIFPNGSLPSIAQIGKAVENLFVMEDWHNFGADYDKTLMAWDQNFETNWEKLKSQYDERFYRMWRYYLLSCAGAFRARELQLWQIMLSKKGVVSGYQGIR
ncbi:MAG: cyclopropane fatty acyl phospholipid synthase [Gammaproteobacteria bacterium]